MKFYYAQWSFVILAILILAFSGVAQKSSRPALGHSQEIQIGLQQVRELHSKLAPRPWTDELPTHIGFWRVRNLNINLIDHILEVEDNQGVLVLNIGGQHRPPLTELSEGFEWSDPIIFWPESQDTPANK